MKHGSLFSGIGGFDLAAEWMGWENIFHCEWNPFGQRILKYYWPKAKSYEDITKTDFIIHRGTIDILTGGFPCQPYSTAGKRLGKEDERHLWPEMLRAIFEIQPRYIVGENVSGIVNWNGGLVFEEVQSNLEDQGYEVLPFLLPACAVNAPHGRERTWFIAYSTSYGLQNDSKGCGQIGKISNTSSNRFYFDRFAQWSSKKRITGIFNDGYGFSSELDGITFSQWRAQSIKGGGNAIVPQVAFEIFKAIQKMEELKSKRNK